ncbi:MAG: WecB/TagA/CpsF family glycosyltransferase [Thermoanaerobacteraceae bacterium]
MEKVNILGVPINKISMVNAVQVLNSFLNEDKFHFVATPNAEFVMIAQKDEEYMKILNTTDLNVPDGIGIVFASKVFKEPIKERVAGFDLMIEFIKSIDQKNTNSPNIYLLGAAPGVAEEAKAKLEKQYPAVNIVGVHDGYFNRTDDEEIIKDINSKNTDILFVALGAPKQEKWIFKNKGKLKVKIAMGVGGSFDVLAGRVERAPLIFRKLGAEWLYRLIKEPWRYKRMAVLPKFVLKVIFTKKKVML